MFTHLLVILVFEDEKSFIRLGVSEVEGGGIEGSVAVVEIVWFSPFQLSIWY